MNPIYKTVTLPSGKEIHIETGRLAKQADGSAVIRCGDTMLLATVVSSTEYRDIDWLPLSVDYVEKFSSAGKIPGGFFKREGKLSDREVLTSRLVDRALRPLFPKDYHSEVQVIIQLISADRVEQSDAMACFAASCALMVSNIPFPDPVSEVRVGMRDGEFIINPTTEEMEGLDMDIMVACTDDSVVMVEGEMNEVSEEDLLNGMKAAHESCRVLNKAAAELRDEVAKEIREYETFDMDEEFVEKITGLMADRTRAVVDAQLPKQERSSSFKEIVDETIESITGELEDKDEKEKLTNWIKAIFKNVQKGAVRGKVLEESVRLDGRQLDEVRDIWSDTSYLPRTHGSAIFTRGETQSLCTVTLGTKLDEQTIDGATIEGKKRFMLHYNFPPFSTGEARFLRGPGRREVGHGNLAERALKIMMPDDYEYTVR
ncbi:MAG: polyribonucleotide nucleotidyltransferase, partial [Bacteroidota bacterium]